VLRRAGGEHVRRGANPILKVYSTYRPDYEVYSQAKRLS
jgi:hypothetical protein